MTRPGLVEQLRRDVSMVLRGLTGWHPPPFETRDTAALALRRATKDGSPLSTRSLEIVEVVRETRDAVTLRLRDPKGPIAFEPGQFFTVLLDVAGQTLRRAYSASSDAGDPDTVTITIKRVTGGVVSNRLNDDARVGDHLRVLGPSGSFVVPEHAAHLVLVAGGSGITPMMSFLRTHLAARPTLHVDLVYGNRSPADIVFADAIAALAARHPDRLRVVHSLSHPDDGWTGKVGMLTRAQLDAILAELAPPADAHYFSCGPEPMMEAARACLEARGIGPDHLHEERFTQPHRRTGAAKSRDGQQVRIVLSNDSRDVYVAPGRSILEAALEANLPMPYSCAMGGCGKCRVRLSSGDVEMDEPNCLTRRERDEGYVLTCIGRPTLPSVLEVT